MRVSARGQITIPVHLRRKFGILKGREVEFLEEDGRLYVRVSGCSEKAKEIVRRMTGKGDVPLSTDEILALTRGKR